MRSTVQPSGQWSNRVEVGVARVKAMAAWLGWAILRACGGAFAGAVFGAAFQVLLFIPIQGPADYDDLLALKWGAGLVAIVAVCVGSWEIPPRFASRTGAFLGGVAAGMLVGVFVVAPLAASLVPIPRDAVLPEYVSLLRSDARRRYEFVGVILGAPIGGVAGMLIAAARSSRLKA
jgi:hypothetical protein